MQQREWGSKVDRILKSIRIFSTPSQAILRYNDLRYSLLVLETPLPNFHDELLCGKSEGRPHTTYTQSPDQNKLTSPTIACQIKPRKGAEIRQKKTMQYRRHLSKTTTLKPKNLRTYEQEIWERKSFPGRSRLDTYARECNNNKNDNNDL